MAKKQLGRPRSSDELWRVDVQARIYQLARARAKKQGVSVSGLLLRGLRAYVTQQFQPEQYAVNRASPRAPLGLRVRAVLRAQVMARLQAEGRAQTVLFDALLAAYVRERL